MQFAYGIKSHGLLASFRVTNSACPGSVRTAKRGELSFSDTFSDLAIHFVIIHSQRHVCGARGAVEYARTSVPGRVSWEVAERG